MPMPSGNARPLSISSGGCGLARRVERDAPHACPCRRPARCSSGVDDDADVGVVHRAVGPDADAERRAGRERLRAERLAGGRLQHVADVLPVGGELGDHAVEDARDVEACRSAPFAIASGVDERCCPCRGAMNSVGFTLVASGAPVASLPSQPPLGVFDVGRSRAGVAVDAGGRGPGLRDVHASRRRRGRPGRS